MRITIDLDAAAVQTAGGIIQQQAQQQSSGRTAEDIDAGPPPPELLETLAMEGALAPTGTAQLRAPDSEAGAVGTPPEPVRATWESRTLMGKRRE